VEDRDLLAADPRRERRERRSVEPERAERGTVEEGRENARSDPAETEPLHRAQAVVRGDREQIRVSQHVVQHVPL
jgi:hypothetical protein